MSDRKLSLNDVTLPVARPRGPRSEASEPVRELAPSLDKREEGLDAVDADLSAAASQTDEEPGSSKSVPRLKTPGSSIRALRPPRKKTTGAQFNVKLDEPLKKRLARAAFENDVDQTVIVRAAIDEFLRKEGY